MPLATRQKATNAATADQSTPGSNRTPPVAGAPKTRMFFVHCRGRAVDTSARAALVLQVLGGTLVTWMGEGAMSIPVSARAAARPLAMVLSTFRPSVARA